MCIYVILYELSEISVSMLQNRQLLVIKLYIYTLSTKFCTIQSFLIFSSVYLSLYLFPEGPSSCAPISKISWLNTDANPLILFSGGLPMDDVDDHHTVTVVYGTDHIALDFTSPVVDYITVVGGCGLHL